MHRYNLSNNVDETSNLVPLEEVFNAYCRLDPTSDSQNAHLLPLSQSDNWMKSAGILDMAKLTTTDTGICFFKFRKRALCFEEYKIFLKDLAQMKQLHLENIILKMQAVAKPLNPREMRRKMQTAQ